MGYNGYGQLGDGTSEDKYQPVNVASDVVAVTAGGDHSLFLKADGTLWAMGWNGYGPLGDGTTVDKYQPVNVASNVVAVAAGSFYSLFVNADGTLWAMGDNGNGELGIGVADADVHPMPVHISNMTVASLRASGATYHSLAVGLLGPVISFNNQFVHLGQPATLTVSIAAGDGPFTYQWQLNGTNLLDATNASYSIPTVAMNDLGIYSVTVTGLIGTTTSTARLMAQPMVMAQPAGGVVNLGQAASLSVTNIEQGALTCQWFKDRVKLVGQTNSTLWFASFQFTNGGSYSVVVSYPEGVVISLPVLMCVPGAPLRAWGYNYYGELGNGTTNNSSKPANVASDVVAVTAGWYHSLFVKADGTLWAMGYNGYGQLGDETTIDKNLPVNEASNVVVVAAGYDHSVFVKADGTLWAMGHNGNGQLGDGTYDDKNQPVNVASDVVAVAAGNGHSLFLKADGTLWAMGANWAGQLGDGTGDERNQPVNVANNVVAMAGGDNHSLFVKADGTLWAMGYNLYGELGDGTSDDKYQPVNVANDVVAVTASGAHSLFVKADGTLWAMGWNSYGQLGDGTYDDKYQPVNVASDVVAVAAGYYHSLFVKADGTLWAMGYNGYGGLGIGVADEDFYPIPVQISNITVASLGASGGAFHSLAVGALSPEISGLANQAIYLGQPVTLSVVITNGDGPFSYQWQFNRTNLLNATNASYSIANVSLADLGTYSVIVTGMSSSVTQNATLTVNVIPAFMTLGNVTQIEGGLQLTVQLTGSTNYPYILQVTTNLTPPVNWQPIFTNTTDVNGRCEFTDTNLNCPQKFYRAVGQ
jgi:alpha-tubulin suppressor-like RCC1 family protein